MDQMLNENNDLDEHDLAQETETESQIKSGTNLPERYGVGYGFIDF